MKNKTILITGGTGSFGQEFVRQLINRGAKKIIVYSRGEFAQVEMKRRIIDSRKRVRYFIGDVRDRNRLSRALCGVHYIIHAAALKHVDVCEYNPFEAIQTNVYGAQNVIDAAIDCAALKVLAISSDKAVNPINLYGATKLCADKLFIAANAYSPQTTQFSVVRFGNFIDSNGSVIPYFRDLKEQGINTFPITDRYMTRFWITLEDAVNYALESLENMKGGEIFNPTMPSARITDIARAICPEARFEEIGVRDGEKIHEEIVTANGFVISSEDTSRTKEVIKKIRNGR